MAAYRKPNKVIKSTTAYLVASIVAGTVHAQQAQRLDEIVVTATKREQSLSDVGLTVSTFSREQMEMRGISDGGDIALATPGLTYTPSQAATPVYTMRGIGFFESSLGAYPTVTLYQNQVPMPFPIMASLVAFDLERVEVMKGPQGTLFGNNATGGAINFIPAQPTEEFAAGINLGYGRFNTREISGYVSGPLGDTVKSRVAIKSVQSDEWQKSYTRNDEVGEKDNIAGRILIDWEPSENLAVQFNLNGWRNQDDPLAPSISSRRPQFQPGAAGTGGVLEADYPILNVPLAPKDNRRADWTPGLPDQDHEFWQTSLRFDYEFANGLTLTSLSSYGELDYQSSIDGTGSFLMGLDLLSETGDMETLSQEFRLANDPDEPFRWMVGVNYEESEVFQLTDLAYQDSTSRRVNGITRSLYFSDQKMENIAGFFNLEFDLTEQITLNAGARQTNAKRTAVGYNGDLGLPALADDAFTVTEFFNLIYGLVYQGAVPTIEDGGSIILDPETLTTVMPRGKLDEDSTSWSLGVDYKPTPDLLLYANVQQGYKAGSFPHLSGAVTTAYETVKEEDVLNFEVGFKLDTSDGRHSLNGALFHATYEDKQLRSKFIDPIFGELDRLENVPESVVQGAELEFNSRPIPGLTLSMSVTYLDTEIREYEGVVGETVSPLGLREPVTASFRGVRLPFAPDWQYSLRGDYEFGITPGLDGFIGLGVDGQTDSIGILTVSSEDKDTFEIGSYALVNANIGVRSTDGRWQAMLWGRNLTNKRYWTNTITAFDTVNRYHGRPEEYGISFSYNF